jgi:DNA-binding GntR family transcriptional regulator
MNIPTKRTASHLARATAGDLGAQQSRRTTTDEIFDHIYADITAMSLKPGTKVSEVDVAKQFDVSRQPVREAFIRLSNMGLLLVRPQRATVVKKISRKEIADARMVRMAIEVEMCRIACDRFDASMAPAFEANLDLQRQAVEKNDFTGFSGLDANFHKLICITADCELAFRTIAENKSQVDRLCALALSKRTEFEQVYVDHTKLYDHLRQNDPHGMIALMRTHLSRLDSTIAEISQSNEDYFEE